MADHAAKAFIGKLGDRAKAKVEGALPEDQYGGRKGGGTDITAHIIQSLLAFARMAGMSVFLLFVDLVAAYDSAIREVAFDLSHDFVGTRVEYLVSIGVDVDVAEFVDSIVSSVGCSFDQAHVDPKTTRMINVLHTRAWAKFGSLASVIVSTKGGRQGCKLGGVVFAMVFAQAMMRVRRELAGAGISLRCSCSSSAPFWAASDPSDGADFSRDVVEVSFVDDAAFALLASTPKALLKAIRVLLDTLTRVFTQFGRRPDARDVERVRRAQRVARDRRAGDRLAAGNATRRRWGGARAVPAMQCKINHRSDERRWRENLTSERESTHEIKREGA